MDNNAFLEQWLEAQKACWQSLAGEAPPSEAAWQGLVDAYQKFVQDPQASLDLGQSFVEQTTQLRQLAEILAQQLADNEENRPPSEPLKAYLHWLQKLQSNLPKENASAHASPWPGNPDPWSSQSPYASHLAEFNAALFAYGLHHTEICQKASSALQHTLSKTGDSLSIRALIDLWCSHYEAAYLEHLIKPEYQQAHGQLTNSWLRMRKAWQNQQHRHAQASGLTSQQEHLQLLRKHQELKRTLNSQQQQLQTTRNELAELKAQSADFDKLRQEVESLKQLLQYNIRQTSDEALRREELRRTDSRPGDGFEQSDH